jgi:hypothetical protein
MESTSRFLDTDINRLSLMWEVPTRRCQNKKSSQINNGNQSNEFSSVKHVQFKEDFRLPRSTERVWKLHAHCYGLHISILTNTIVDIIHRPLFCLMQNVLKTRFCLLRLQVEPIQLNPIDRARHRDLLYILISAECVPPEDEDRIYTKHVSIVFILTYYFFLQKKKT